MTAALWNARKMAAEHASRWDWRKKDSAQSSSERKLAWIDTYLASTRPAVLGLIEVQANFPEMKVLRKWFRKRGYDMAFQVGLGSG